MTRDSVFSSERGRKTPLITGEMRKTPAVVTLPLSTGDSSVGPSTMLMADDHFSSDDLNFSMMKTPPGSPRHADVGAVSVSSGTPMFDSSFPSSLDSQPTVKSERMSETFDDDPFFARPLTESEMRMADDLEFPSIGSIPPPVFVPIGSIPPAVS